MYEEQDASAYNRNTDTQAIENVKCRYDYWRERPSTGTRVSSGGVNIIFSDSNTHHRGAENYRRSGEVDAMRIPKDGHYAHQVMWDGWVDVEPPRAHLIGHWNYGSGTVKPVTVISSAKRVNLMLNGKLLGQGRQSERFLFTFDAIAWQPGEMKEIGYDDKGKRLGEAVLVTAGAPVALRLTATTSPAGLQADQGHAHDGLNAHGLKCVLSASRQGRYSACMFCLTVSISDAIASAAFLPAMKAWSEL